MPGSLFVVATPIGNLEDLTFRALRILRSVDVIAAEDTRRTAKLLAHYEISRPVVSLHEHNEHREAARLVDRIRGGDTVALVSDAGTPAISDPGAVLVRLCRDASLPVMAVPGASAVTAALSVTGITAVPFTFLGFPPSGETQRRAWLEAADDTPGVLVLFEAPHRVAGTVREINELSKRPIFVHREISKIHESFVTYQSSADISNLPPVERGEIVLVLGPAPLACPTEIDDSELLQLVSKLEELGWLSSDQVLEAAAAATRTAKTRLRNRIKKAKILVKRQIDQEP